MGKKWSTYESTPLDELIEKHTEFINWYETNKGAYYQSNDKTFKDGFKFILQSFAVAVDEIDSRLTTNGLSYVNEDQLGIILSAWAGFAKACEEVEEYDSASFYLSRAEWILKQIDPDYDDYANNIASAKNYYRTKSQEQAGGGCLGCLGILIVGFILYKIFF